MGHAGLPSKAQWNVHVSLYQAVLPRPTAAHMPSPPKTADEVLVQRLSRKLDEYHASLAGTRAKAIDGGI